MELIAQVEVGGKPLPIKEPLEVTIKTLDVVIAILSVGAMTALIFFVPGTNKDLEVMLFAFLIMFLIIFFTTLPYLKYVGNQKPYLVIDDRGLTYKEDFFPWQQIQRLDFRNLCMMSLPSIR